MKKQWTTVSDFILHGKVSSKYAIIEVEGINQVGDGGALTLVRTGNVGTPNQSFTDTGNNTCIDDNGDVWEVQKGTILNYNGTDNWFGGSFGSDGVGAYILNDSSTWEIFPDKQDIAKGILESQQDLLGGKLFKGSNGEYVQNGDVVPVGTTHIRVLVNGEPAVLVAWDELTLPATVTSIPTAANDFLEYEVETNQGTFKFVTHEVNSLRGKNNFPTVKLEVYIDGWGAKTDGTDASPALQAAALYASSVGVDSVLPGNTVTVSTSAQIVCLGDKYTFNSLINLGSIRSLNLRGSGKTVFEGDAILPVLIKATNLRFMHVEDVWFQNFDEVFSAETANLDGAKWIFDDCWIDGCNKFIDTVKYSTSRSTIVTFNQCHFYSRCLKVGEFYIDTLTFNECWFQNRGDTGQEYIKANSNVIFNGGMRIPVGTPVAGSSFLLFTNDDGDGSTVNEYTRNVTFNGMRASNEGGNTPLVVSDMPTVASQAGGTPMINFISMFINTYHSVHYEGSETGVVQIAQYGAGVSFKGCSFVGLVNDRSYIIAKNDAVSSDANGLFRVDMDETSYHSAKQVASQNSTAIAGSLRQYINNPDPYQFRGVLDGGNFDVVDSGTVGVKKLTFTLRPTYNDPLGTYPIPSTFYITTFGFGTETNNNLNYSGSSTYLVKVFGFFQGTHQARIEVTPIQEGGYGIYDGTDYSANTDIVSAHFGSGDTGSSDAPRASEYTVTITFGTNVVHGRAVYDPIITRTRRDKITP